MLRMNSRRLVLVCGMSLIAVMLLAAWSIMGHASQLKGHNVLSNETMSNLWGAGSCMNCRYIGARIDECYHEYFTDPCAVDGCIANYAIDNTCDLGTGTCNALLDSTGVGLVQYSRADSGCVTNHPNGWSTWMTRYYGNCATLTDTVRCEKTAGSCDGTLIESSARNPGVECY